MFIQPLVYFWIMHSCSMPKNAEYYFIITSKKSIVVSLTMAILSLFGVTILILLLIFSYLELMSNKTLTNFNKYLWKICKNHWWRRIQHIIIIKLYKTHISMQAYQLTQLLKKQNNKNNWNKSKWRIKSRKGC